MTTLRELIADTARRLDAAGVASPRVDAELLVRHALDLDRLGLLLRAEQEVPGEAVARVAALARRRETREPLQHILGEAPFGDLMLRVTRDVLIPRPETEVLLHLTLNAIRGVQVPRVLDVGTGSGALALSVKAARADAEVWATDLSEAALTVARANAEQLGLAVHFAHGDLHAHLPGPFDLIVSNPPYLPESDAQNASPEVQRDPELALYAGPDGLSVARRLVAIAGPLLTTAGWLALELDPRNVRQLAGEMTHWTVQVHSDLTGRDRFLLARPSG